MSKNGKERIIYDNYSLYDREQDTINFLMEEGHTKDEITEDMVWDQIYMDDATSWDIEYEMMQNFFAGKTLFCFGTIERWNGNFHGGNIFSDFSSMLSMVLKDCEYVKLYDINGHFYIQCSHHDGTNHFEIKLVTDVEEKYLDRWETNWNDSRTETQVHQQIMKRYSHLPHYVNKCFGCKKIEYV